MHKDSNYEDHNPEIDYEKSDAAPKPIVYFGIGLLVMTVLSGALVWGVEAVMRFRDAKNEKARFIVKDERWSSPQIQLEVRPGDARRLYEKHQKEAVTSYGWIDPARQIVRIPIERAMQIALQKGYPVRKSAPEEIQKLFVPGESGGPVNIENSKQNPHVSA